MSKQHGFRRGMSCKIQLIEAMYDWTNIKQRKWPDSKSFDVMLHRLSMKQYMYGITGKMHSWIKDFNRKQNSRACC